MPRNLNMTNKTKVGHRQKGIRKCECETRNVRIVKRLFWLQQQRLHHNGIIVHSVVHDPISFLSLSLLLLPSHREFAVIVVTSLPPFLHPRSLELSKAWSMSPNAMNNAGASPPLHRRQTQKPHKYLPHCTPAPITLRPRG